MSFQSVSNIKATRKPHTCEHCLTKIAVGESATRSAGVYDGDFYCSYMHPECEEWGLDYAKRGDLWGEEFVWLHQVSGEIGGQDYAQELRYMIEHHPKVAERLGAAARIKAIEAEHA